MVPGSAGSEEISTSPWGEYPIFLLAGKSGVALFPAKLTDPILDQKSRHIKIDHFAFNVTRENFEKAKRWHDELKIDYNIQDHHYFESIYTDDPDGHTVELTTLKVPVEDFYKW